MLKEFVSDINFLYKDIVNGNKQSLSKFKEKWNVKKSIGEIYQNLCKKESKKNTGRFYTPVEIVDFMVSDAISKINYKQNIYIKILDPCCGGGYFLICIYEKLIEMAKELKLENPEQHIINNNIFGFDTDNTAVLITKIELYERSGVLSDNILEKDFLLSENTGFDIIIGNPPYMGHKVLSEDYRRKLSSKYDDVFRDKGDISYCFIKKSVNSLYEGGILQFFTSRYMLEALNGKGIRNFLSKNFIDKIIDFYGVRVIKGVGIDNIILTVIKQKPSNSINYYKLNISAKDKGSKVFEDIKLGENKYVSCLNVKSDSLKDDGWIFLSTIEENVLNKIKGVELNILCDSFQGVITGCDSAFVMDNNTADELLIEKGILKPWIKNKDIKPFYIEPSSDVLIYTNDLLNIENYKNALKHIENFKEKLKLRRECKKGLRKWYEIQWGRDKRLFENKKIVYPFKASSNRFALDEGSYFSADVYGIRIKDMFQGMISYEYLLGILNSRIYEFYIKSMAKKLGDNLYEYYPNKIMKLKIPNLIKEVEDEVISKKDNFKDNIDNILKDYFKITDEEYEAIKKWCN
ncbi:MAG TPA: DNA methyltransferase [Clostridiaceae bacterium]|jgi:adenine-specific DNA-methyltransferase|nr:DNA methyltransferase [Clostridiaceae bacterium]HBF76497.1 DNA methyltransferase [Clostridiaceae bacterium]HBN27510.1 DNA methyltransferase [Clostridiaceae bacterium]HBX48413.1 DNA methyltransferase [Clostridiaceae bacterium]